ncbi:hypothetical protein [Magnetospirillum molischianum]|uniref:Co-chaperone DjlA N-terminal domain-containing protein n=1 Tax=Magnetospirillum molischianum DSM 120 TaxID=1150626 RepID=H8FUX0_MAGML|nr:hypothetical protein [Magnetospirillum molischianum]CCG42158.1 hypothetical protein PHAMO_340031 [Magnetospirillum molischianum DSM 120]
MSALSFLRQLIRRSDQCSPLVAESVALSVPPTDAPEESVSGREFHDAEDLIGSTFVLVYRNAKGEESTRRVTLRGIADAAGDAAVCLRCWCHERNAFRSFRSDRVVRVIDLDGEVHLPARFFADLLAGVVAAAPVPAWDGHLPPVPAPVIDQPAPHRAEPPGHAQRRVARDGIRVLVGLSRSDGWMAPEEVEVILDYIAARADLDGIATTEADRVALTPYLRRMYPQSTVMDECLTRLDAEAAEARRLFTRAAIRLVEADGVQSPEEFALLLDLGDRVRSA